MPRIPPYICLKWSKKENKSIFALILVRVTHTLDSIARSPTHVSTPEIRVVHIANWNALIKRMIILWLCQSSKQVRKRLISVYCHVNCSIRTNKEQNRKLFCIYCCICKVFRPAVSIPRMIWFNQTRGNRHRQESTYNRQTKKEWHFSRNTDTVHNQSVCVEWCWGTLWYMNTLHTKSKHRLQRFSDVYRIRWPWSWKWTFMIVCHDTRLQNWFAEI